MAKQAGPNYIEGRFGNIVFYQLDGYYYARMKSRLSGKRVKKDPLFKKTMYYAGLLGQASKIAAAVYRGIPAKDRTKNLYREITGQAMRLLKAGISGIDVRFVLEVQFKEVVRDPIAF